MAFFTNNNGPARAESDDNFARLGDGEDSRSDTFNDREIIRTKRHTLLVRTLRVLLPISSVCVVALYGLSAFRAADWADVLPALAIPNILPDKLTMDNPRYTGYNDDGGSYNVTAKTAAQDFKRPGVILLNDISGELVDADDSKTFMEAVSGEFNTRKNHLRLSGGIDIHSADGMRAKLSSAAVQTKMGVIRSNDPVHVAMRSSTLRANKMTLWQKRKEVLFRGDVRAHLMQEAPPKSDQAVPAPKPATSGALFSDSRAPVDVTALALRVVSAENVAVFSGSVRARQDDASLATRELDVHFEDAKDNAQASKTEKPAKTGSPFDTGSQKISRIVAKYPVLISRGEDQQVTSQSAEFFVADQRAILNGKVVIVAGDGRRAQSDRALVDQAKETVLLEGNVVVGQGKNSLRGRTLFVDRKRGRMELTSPPGDGAGPGRINATLHRDGEQGAKKSKQKAKVNSGVASNVTAFKTDPSAPIEVESDSLNVDNGIRAAVFRGNVVAKQGSFQIKSSSLSVQYSGQIDVADPITKGTNGGASGKGNGPELKMIVAKKNVKVTSQTGQVATGDRAEFDVVENSIEISGNVLLRQGNNFVHGTRLKIDMDSGRSVIETSPENAANGTAWSANSAGSASGKAGGKPAGFSSNGERPSAVFFPFQLKKAKEAVAKKKPREAPAKSNKSGSAAKGASSWSATSEPAEY